MVQRPAEAVSHQYLYSESPGTKRTSGRIASIRGDLGTVHGLPEKSRWALERTLAIDAIARFADGERFGLDADAAWPRLKVGAEAFERYVHDLQ